MDACPGTAFCGGVEHVATIEAPSKAREVALHRRTTLVQQNHQPRIQAPIPLGQIDNHQRQEDRHTGQRFRLR